jgi:isopenicillin-N N-acyltransferase-like protein
MIAMPFFPVIELRGAPYEMGVVHGRTLTREIKGNAATYTRLIGDFTGLDGDKVLELAGGFVPRIKDAAPAVLEEMEGIAQGSGVPLGAVLVLNARTELMFPSQLGRECTAVGLRPERTCSGAPIIAQNWDWKPELKFGSALFRREPKQGAGSLVFCEAGQVCKIGLNEHGLGVLLNILITEDVQPGIPVHVLLRMVLDCRDVLEAAALVKRAVRASSSHFLLGDESGRILGLELSPAAVCEIAPESGAVVHTNHFCDPDFADRDRGPSVIPDSQTRLRRAREVLAGEEKWDVNDLKSLLTDHQHGPSSICRHVNPADPEPGRMETVGSFILDLSGRRLLATYGQPCQNPYQEVALDSPALRAAQV